jgi:hypothetical protein
VVKQTHGSRAGSAEQIDFDESPEEEGKDVQGY